MGALNWLWLEAVASTPYITLAKAALSCGNWIRFWRPCTHSSITHLQEGRTSRFLPKPHNFHCHSVATGGLRTYQLWEGFRSMAFSDHVRGCSQDQKATKSRHLIFWHPWSGTERSSHHGKTLLLHVCHQDLQTLPDNIPNRWANDAIPCEWFGRIDDGNYVLLLSIVCISDFIHILYKWYDNYIMWKKSKRRKQRSKAVLTHCQVNMVVIIWVTFLAFLFSVFWGVSSRGRSFRTSVHSS